MFNFPSIDFSQAKKLKILLILKEEGENSALRLYPEFSDFIYSCRGKSYEVAYAELIDASQHDLILH